MHVETALEWLREPTIVNQEKMRGKEIKTESRDDALKEFSYRRENRVVFRSNMKVKGRFLFLLFFFARI